MIFPPITELTLVGVDEPGIPNRERILLRPTEPVNLAQFGIFIGHWNENGLIIPWFDHFFWFGNLLVEPPSWIIVSSGKGEYQQTTEPKSKHVVHSMHWGRDRTLFNLPEIVPVLFRMDGILIGQQLIPATKQLNK